MCQTPERPAWQLVRPLNTEPSAAPLAVPFLQIGVCTSNIITSLGGCLLTVSICIVAGNVNAVLRRLRRHGHRDCSTAYHAGYKSWTRPIVRWPATSA